MIVTFAPQGDVNSRRLETFLSFHCWTSGGFSTDAAKEGGLFTGRKQNLEFLVSVHAERLKKKRNGALEPCPHCQTLCQLIEDLKDASNNLQNK